MAENGKVLRVGIMARMRPVARIQVEPRPEVQQPPRPAPGNGKTAPAEENAEPVRSPTLGQEIQQFGTLCNIPTGLDDRVRRAGVLTLNQVLADTLALADLYRKHHWQVSSCTFYQLHLLFDKHYGEQEKLADGLAERVQTLGGISIASPWDVAATTRTQRPPRGREEYCSQITRLLDAHAVVLAAARVAARSTAASGDDGSNNFLVSDVIPVNEKQVWFLAEHLVGEDYE